jgi:hypothetical protein
MNKNQGVALIALLIITGAALAVSQIMDQAYAKSLGSDLSMGRSTVTADDTTTELILGSTTGSLTLQSVLADSDIYQPLTMYTRPNRYSFDCQTTWTVEITTGGLTVTIAPEPAK